MDIERLIANDCKELTAFLDRVFSAHNGYPMDFAAIFPRIFVETDETMRWYYAVKDNGRIVGTAASHPMYYRVAGETLKVSAGGNVAVAEEYRGQGIMQKLLNRINEDLAEEDFDFAFLHGDRKRYRTFGFERCGKEYTVTFSRSMLKQLGILGGDSFSDLRKEPQTVLTQVLEISKQQISGFERNAKDFIPALLAHKREPLVIRNAQKELIGYVSLGAKEQYVAELGLKDPKDFPHVLMSILDYAQIDSFAIRMPEYDWPYVSQAVAICSRYQIIQPGNFKVLHLDKVIRVFLKAKAQYAPLMDGSLTVRTELFGTWTISVNAGEVSVLPGDGPVDVTLPGYTVYAFLFGPNDPFLAGGTVAPQKAALVGNWFPLPIYCPNLS